MTLSYSDIAELLIAKKDCVVLSGAGISAESGIPTFRTKGGLWEKYDPTVYASVEVFRKDPSKYWQIRGDFIREYATYEPNAAHRALVRLEKIGIVRHVITQNIDGLHRKAGSQNVIEIHGSLREIICQLCDKVYLAPNIPEGTPPYCSCGGVLKPNTVLFGEQLPPEALDAAIHESSTCKVMLVIGTSAVVYPAAQLPVIAKQNGATIVEINIERAFPDADHVFLEKAGRAMSKILEAVQKS